MNPALTSNTLWDTYQALPTEEQQDILAILEKKQPLSIDELIQHMNDKGITFHIVSEEAAKNFLENHNYYFKLAAYRGNYTKYPQGYKKGQYQHLEFAYLQELSTIDMHLRYVLLSMCLDIEHQLKLMLLNDIEKSPNENGYSLINTIDPHKLMRAKFLKQSPSSYAHDLIEKHRSLLDFPIWAVCEIISFGELITLYRQYLTLFSHRMRRHADYFSTNPYLQNAYLFCTRLIRYFFSTICQYIWYLLLYKHIENEQSFWRGSITIEPQFFLKILRK